MKLETGIVIAKGTAYVGAGFCTALVTNLGQWANSGEWPPKINWVVIIGGAVGAGFINLLSFLSGSFTNYMQGRTPTGNTQFISKPPSP